MGTNEELLEEASRFFSNTNIYIDSGNIERISYKKYDRNEVQDVFDTPKHTVDTNSLLVFKNGLLQIKDRDYNDINSTQIRFTDEIDVNKDIDILLISSGDPIVFEGDIVWEGF